RYRRSAFRRPARRGDNALRISGFDLRQLEDAERSRVHDDGAGDTRIAHAQLERVVATGAESREHHTFATRRNEVDRRREILEAVMRERHVLDSIGSDRAVADAGEIDPKHGKAELG